MKSWQQLQDELNEAKARVAVCEAQMEHQREEISELNRELADLKAEKRFFQTSAENWEACAGKLSASLDSLAAVVGVA